MDYIHMHKSGHALPRTPRHQCNASVDNWETLWSIEDSIISSLHMISRFTRLYIYTIIIYVHIYIRVYLVGGIPPPWKIWLRQLGWWNSHEWKNKINVPNHQPYIYIYTLDYYTVVPLFRLAWVPQSSSLCGFSSVSKDIRRILGVDPDSTFAGAPVC